MYPSIVVQLGRIGDILNILPACKDLGLKRMMIHPDFECALLGQTHVMSMHWHGDTEDLRSAVLCARKWSDDVRVAQLYGRVQPDGLSPRSRPSFVADQWDRLQPGLGDLWGTLPLEFDYRCKEREDELVKKYILDQRPVLLVNFFSHSSPVDDHYAQQIWQHLASHWGWLRIIDIGQIRAFAYCDLLALYERAIGIITADTASLHLCRACPNLKTFRFVRPDRDATPIRPIEQHQPYGYRGMDRIDAFIASLKGAAQ